MEATLSPQHVKEDSIPKATLASDNPPQLKKDSILKTNSPPKHRENLTARIVSTS